MEKRKSEAERRIILQAQIDSLTGITNRDAFNRALSEVFKVNEKREEIAIVLIDLDNFKEINDTRGHEIGDEILKVTASRFMNQLASAKLLSRLGGDEFIFILEGDEAKEHHVLALCDRVQNIIKQPILLEHGEVMLTASVGVSIYPHDGQDVRSILGAADQAMYHAKQSGRSTTRRFNKELKDDLVAKMELAQDLREAIQNQEFYLLYQPILNKNGDVIKFEALIRWQHPTKGLVPPDQFITFAEESGQIIEVGHWVIQEAKRALKAIQEVHGKHVQISVNVSPVQLSQYQGEKAQLLEELLAENSDEQGTQAQNGLVVEITENLLMNSDESTRNALLAFREQGVQVALDDFGTGYSSLAYIMNYDIDYLKIDQSFVQKLENEKASQTLCEAIISMAHALGVAVIAEGVETQKQADLLLGYQCDYLQGFYFSRPIPLDQALLYKREK
ncbi:putative bifunctional diguanylate cyclase/phosphodiesterase [Marinomonas sp. GJ51-6]|uniref:putative bifunctional diguanylate cyclase/phosphodiesterase n=1 Tax=Marinomonas sp. GJ51-6 TaxID=2992802 RepID=UPI0029347342|nr:EAL domain-containing protein [Marinomonas sp. GJ51-6]WOD09298.1 EAL domain-containing protein [Marinomonas sp. GJ51-6]